MPNLSARTPACITTMRPSAIKLIVCEGSMVKKLFSLFSIISGPIRLILGIENKALIISTKKLSGVEQMSLDLRLLDHTISEPEIMDIIKR